VVAELSPLSRLALRVAGTVLAVAFLAFVLYTATPLDD
jgi:uncharacterized membrane protein YccC